jgi:asparagine synthetase B (glutamine-hydrolysing)
MSLVRLMGQLDPNFAWDGTRLYEGADFGPNAESPRRLAGAAVSVRTDGRGRWRVLRDPLGLNKLFWARDDAGGIVFAGRPRLLVESGYPFEAIQAFPRASVLDLRASPARSAQYELGSGGGLSRRRNSQRIELLGAEIRRKLDLYMEAIARARAPAQTFVCLSGGLDSSGIAALAREHFPSVVAVSFDLERRGGRPSEDRLAAERLARDLGIPVLAATTPEAELFEKLDLVLTEGIDWRDFNVHAALVNAALAEAIHDALGEPADPSSTLVLTGDLANEFLVDYQPESHRGVTYYELPRIQPAALRASLVRGLDTCHREVGVFAAWNLPLVQPYAVAVEDYLKLPGEFLELGDRKQQLARAVFGGLVPEYVYSRGKVRAQVGSANVGGVLAACAEWKLDASALRKRFADLHKVSDPAALERFIRAGRYRAAVPSVRDGDRGSF